MIQWPKREDFVSRHETIFGREIVLHLDEKYERARAEAAIERLKVAVELLREVQPCLIYDSVNPMRTVTRVKAFLDSVDLPQEA